MRPHPSPEVRLCLKLSIDGLTAYGNRHAISALRDQMDWILNSDPSDNFECHVVLTMENDESKFFGHRPSNVRRVVSEEIVNLSRSELSNIENSFELTIMQVSESQLNDLENTGV